jgi:hypothetical protein
MKLSRSQFQRELRQLRADIEAALADGLGDLELRDRLEHLAQRRAFCGYAWLWGPPLYPRSRVVFRPFILSHFSESEQAGPWRWRRVPWRGAVGEALEAWLRQADADGDVELCRRLYGWKLREIPARPAREARWRQDLRQRFEAAATPARRLLELGKLDLWLALDEDAALALYAVDAARAAPFILRHLPFAYRDSQRALWKKLAAAARERGDGEFAHALYRKQVRLKDWEQDALAQARALADPAALCEALERLHPEGYALDLGGALYRLLELRGADALPYARRHLREVWPGWRLRGGYDQLVELARERGWLELWAGLIVTCARPKGYNKEVARLLDDARLPDEQVQARLRLLSGVSREWNFGGFGLAQVQMLEPAVALKLYQRYPGLVRGPFKAHIAPSWWQPQDGLLRRAIEQGDAALVDFLASRLLTWPRWSGHPMPESVDWAADYYLALKLDERDFARRAAAVLTLVPAYAIHRYDRLIEDNRLARLLFERSAPAFLADAGAVRDLVEGSEIHVQQLAYRALAQDDERARELARDNLPILLGTLLRPLHRATRLAAFGALANAASTPEAAATVLERARLAQALPDAHYPKEALLGLIARILHAYPHLAGPEEQPVVYRRHAA